MRVLCCCLILAASCSFGGNLLLNAGFQYAPDGSVSPNSTAQHWQAWGTATRESWGCQDNDGYLASLHNWTATDASAGWYQDIAGFHNTKYHFSAYLCADVGHTSAAARLKIEFFSAGYGAMVGAATTTVSDLRPHWTRCEVEGTSPGNAVYVRAVVEVVGQGTVGALKIDNVNLQALPLNMLRNPGFAYGWGGATGVNVTAHRWQQAGAATRENWGSFDGDGYFATIHNWFGDAADGYWYQDVEGEGGAHYVFAGYFCAGGSYTASSLGLKLEFYDIDRQQIGMVSTPLAGLSADWQLYEVMGTAPTGTWWMRPVIGATGQGTSGELKADNVRLAGSSANRLQNSGFQLAPDGTTNSSPDAQHWSRWGDATRESWGSHDGDGHLGSVHNWGNTNSAGGWFQDVPGMARYEYVLSAYLEADTNYTYTTADLKLEFYDFNWQFLSIVTAEHTGIPSSWTYYDVKAVAPEKTAWVRAVAAVSGQGTNGAFKLDELRLTSERRAGLQRLEPEQGAYAGAKIDWGAGDAVGFNSLMTWDHALFGEFIGFPSGSYDYLNGHLEQLRQLGAIYFVTLCPTGLDATATNEYETFAGWCSWWNQQGVPIVIRYAHEMNSSWNAWGMKPAQYRATFRLLADRVHRMATNTVMSWAPYVGGHYPGDYADMTRAEYTNGYGTLEDWCLLDSDGNGIIKNLVAGGADDPYDPFYPGDDYVDWVGLSIYHWGPYVEECCESCGWWGFRYNNYPPDRRYSDDLTGKDSWVPDFYGDYAEGQDKPVILAETSAAYRPSDEVPPGSYPNFTNDEVYIKSKWINQLYNTGGDNANALDIVQHFPKVKAFAWFDYYKFEPAGCATVDWRIVSNPDVRSNYLGHLNTRKGGSRYLLTADDLRGYVYGWNSSLEGWTPGGSPFNAYVVTNSPYERRGCVRIDYDGSATPGDKVVMADYWALPDVRGWGDFTAIYLHAKVPADVPWASFRLVLQSAENGWDVLATVACTPDGAWHQLAFPYVWSRHDSSSWLNLYLQVDLPNGTARTLYVDGLQAVADNDADGTVDEGDPDDDNDGMTDVYENSHGLNALDAGDADEDYDWDGATNYEESRMNTHPWLSSSVLRVLKINALDLDSFTLSWDGRSGVTYQCQAAAAVTGVWGNVGAPIAAPAHMPLGFTNDCGDNTRFYRLAVP